MGSHALTRMPPVGELQQDGRLTVTDQRLFDDPDYLLRIITRDLPAYQQLYDNRLATMPDVSRHSSTLVMTSVVENLPLPL